MFIVHSEYLFIYIYLHGAYIPNDWTDKLLCNSIQIIILSFDRSFFFYMTMIKSKLNSQISDRQSEETSKLADMLPDDDFCESNDRDKEEICDQENGVEDIRNIKCKTSFSVDDILSPSKFNGQVTNFAPEYFMRWQPWLMQEALRHNCTFPDLALSFYKPFLNSYKDGKRFVKQPKVCVALDIKYLFLK